MRKILIGLLAFAWCLNTLSAQNFTLKSNELGGQATQKQFFNGMSCTGENISPQLSWTGAPEGTKSFAVTIYDKDAPTGSGWWHWIIFNIPANVTELKSNAGNLSAEIFPIGSVQSITDFGKPGYGGPCPPAGAPHEYLITVFALKCTLDLNQNASPGMVGYNLYANTLAKASIVMYAKQ